MRVTSLAVVLCLAAGSALAQGGGESVPVCENLVALRQWAAGAGEDPARAAAQAETPPACRLVARGSLGAVERRSTFGGAIYECLAQAGGPCVWVMP